MENLETINLDKYKDFYQSPRESIHWTPNADSGLGDIVKLVLTDMNIIINDDAAIFEKEWLSHIKNDEQFIITMQLSVNNKAYNILNLIIASKNANESFQNWVEHIDQKDQWKVDNLNYHSDMSINTATLCARVKSKLTDTPLIMIMKDLPRNERHLLLKYMLE